MTKAREAVLAAVEASTEPISAADVRRRMGDDADLATVYRALHWLSDAAYVEEFAFACEKRGVERYYVSKKRPHGHFFHCEGRHRFIPVDGRFADEIGHRLETEQGFRVVSHTLYYTGLCPACGAAER